GPGAGRHELAPFGVGHLLRHAAKPTARAGPGMRGQDRASFSRNSSTPWFWVVTKPVKLGFGMSQFENRIGIDPEISIWPAVVRSADSGNVTARVCPCRVRLPDAVYFLITPSAGSGAIVIGLVSVSVPVGYVAVSMIRPLNWTSRWLSSLLMVFIGTVN